ncbi:MAG: histidine kinase [Betaproteobacteria bacterium]|nr:histidine kinase [Betaproteobacteria bacterium]
MQVRYPRSFLTLLLVGFSLVALPLIAALLNNAVSIDRLADQSRKAVYQAAQATHASRAQVELVTGMERMARQYLVLGDAALLESYRTLHERFLESTRQFPALPVGAEQRKLLEQMSARDGRIYELLSQEPVARGQDGRLQAVVAEFETLSDLAHAMMALSNGMIDKEVGALQDLAGTAHRIMLLQLLALLPVALFLVAGFAYLIARPIRQLDRGIRSLGTGDFGADIVVNGPQDLEYLGGQLNWLRLRLMELEAQKARFLQHVSHELKTPLTALREGSDLLTEEVAGPLNPRQREIVRILRDNSIQLRRLIEDLLSYSAAQGQHSAIQRQPVKMRDVIERVASDQKLALEAREIRLALDCGEVELQGDEEKLRVIVDNLFSNAVKFSPPGGAISLRLAAAAGAAVLEVTDEGPGVAPEDRDRIFDAFYQGRAPVAGPVKGTGLGLSIAREYAALHHGRIELVTETRRGGHFRVILPL